jgi:hypothetical protein
MRPESPPETLAPTVVWSSARAELAEAEQDLLAAPAGIVRQAPYDRFLAAQRSCTELTHGWLARALELESVVEPRLVLSLDVDGILEDERDGGFTSTGVTGAAALRLLQLGGVSVLLNTARSLEEVRTRSGQFHLLGGVSAFGAALWDGVFGRERSLLSDRGAEQLNRLRGFIRADPSVVIDGTYPESLRVAAIHDGRLHGLAGSRALRLLDQHGLASLSYWVAPRHTDFVDRTPDKGDGIMRLREELRLTSLPMAAIGDATCDLPMLRAASFAFLPAATLPSYVPPRRQHLVRSRHLGEQALWDAACHLVGDRALERRVLDGVARLTFPTWFPQALRQAPRSSSGLFPRLAAAIGSIRSST